MSAIDQLRRSQERWAASSALRTLHDHVRACDDCGGRGPAKKLCPLGVTLRDVYWGVSMRRERSPDDEPIQLTIFDLDIP